MTTGITDYKQLAEAHAETLRAVLLDLAFYKRDAITDGIAERCIKALSQHREVAA